MKLWSPLAMLVALSACRATATTPAVTVPVESPRPTEVAPAPTTPVDAGAVPAGPTPDAVVDLDGDGRPDEVFNRSLRVVRNTASGPQREYLTISNADSSDCSITGRFALNGRVALVVEGTGHDTDHEPGRATSSDSWGAVGVFEFTPGAEARLVWEYRVEANHTDDTGHWSFAAQPDGSLLATSTLGDDTPTHAAMTARLARNQQGLFEQVGCWQATPPSTAEAQCETTLGSNFRLRLTEAREPTASASGQRAGTRVRVLQRGSVRRGAATLSCVRVLGDAGGVGWTFVTDAERARCTPTR